MSDNIPFEIQELIIKRVLPVKSLLRFRSVSKQWKLFVDSSEFIAHHHRLNQTNPDNLLLRYRVAPEAVNVNAEYSSIIDDASFPQQKFSPVVTPIVKLVDDAIMLDSSHGLVFLYGKVADGKSMVVLWNPSIGKSVGIELPRGSIAIGFGVCPKTLDTKILKSTLAYGNEFVDWPIELFTLSSGASRTISANKQHFLLENLRFKPQHKVIEGVMYWSTYDSLLGDGHNVIVSFDLTTEEFGEIQLPDSLASVAQNWQVSIFGIKQSLVLLDIDDDFVCDVWMLMKNVFTKLFTVSFDEDGFNPINITGFRKNGEVIKEQQYEHDGSMIAKLEAYEPSTKHISDLGTRVVKDIIDPPYMISSYSESLLLVNHSDSIIQG